MKKIALLLILTLSVNAFSKNDTLTIYYDENWKKTSQDNFTYYRKMYKSPEKVWVAKDYFKSGKLQMMGTFLDKKGKKHNGHFVFYYENGNKQYERFFRKGWYSGPFKAWYESGQLETEGSYADKGIKTGLWKGYREDGTLDYEVNRLLGERNGTSTYYYENGQVSAIKTYKNGEILSIENYNEDGSPLPPDQKGDFEPYFPGGTDAMNAFIVENINYPQEAIESLQRGISYISFVVEKDGSLTEVEVRKSSHPLLDKEALRVINAMPEWIPGKVHNRVVRCTFTIPIHFRLK